MNKVELMSKIYQWDSHTFQRNREDAISLDRFRGILKYMNETQVTKIPPSSLDVQPLQSWRINEDCIYSNNEFLFLNYIMNNIEDNELHVSDMLICDIDAICIHDKLFIVGTKELGNFFCSVDLDDLLRDNVIDQIESLSQNIIKEASISLGYDILNNPVNLSCEIINKSVYVSITSPLINYPMTTSTLKLILILAKKYRGLASK